MLQDLIDNVSITFRSKANFQLIEYLRTDYWWCNRSCSYNYTSTRMFMMKRILWIVQSINFLDYKFHILPECSCVLHKIHCNSSAKIKLTIGTIGKNANHKSLGRRCSAFLLYENTTLYTSMTCYIVWCLFQYLLCCSGRCLKSLIGIQVLCRPVHWPFLRPMYWSWVCVNHEHCHILPNSNRNV